MTPTLAHLRRFAVARSLFAPTSLAAAVERMGFVQADPIRAPARAQDLTLRHRVRNYRAGDLERQYRRLAIEEDFFVNYGFVPRRVHALMHPRALLGPWPAPGKRTADQVLAHVRQRGVAHPREVDAHFARGSVTNYWGGSSSATTHLLDHLHYRGLLRVAGRASGVRLYAPPVHAETLRAPAERRAGLDALVDVVVGVYAPVPSATLRWLVSRLRLAAPQWRADLPAALARAKARLSHARVEGIDWYWPAGEALAPAVPDDAVRLLAPFDPVVWDRRRFEHFWGWPYRFEAYTPAAKRSFGYYSLPLLWRDRVVGWANVSLTDGALVAQLGYARGRPAASGFARACDDELERMRRFLTPASRPSTRQQA